MGMVTPTLLLLLFVQICAIRLSPNVLWFIIEAMSYLSIIWSFVKSDSCSIFDSYQRLSYLKSSVAIHPGHMISLCPRHQSLIIVAACGERGWEMSYKLDPKTLSMRGLMWWWRVEHWITIMIGKGFDPFQCNKEHKFKCHKKCASLEDEHVQLWRSTTNSDVNSPLLHYAFMQDNL